MNLDSSIADAAPRTLIDALLEEQRDLSAVARFARWHDVASVGDAHAQNYRDLIPLTRPSPGEQFGFEVDLDACSGCKACVTACHALNGLEDDESWRKVGLLVGNHRSRSSAPSVLQHVTTACHHCVEPGCLEGCPVLAYDKDPVTGIVRHLDDQCIGCSYCVMMCPYEVPQYSERLGIVRKCDLCQGRLAAGEAPACVQACPTSAIRVRIVSREETVNLWRRPTLGPAASTFLPVAPRPSLTIPATRFLSRRPELQATRAADEEDLVPADGHTPLVGFLVLSQLSVGLMLMVVLGAWAGDPTGAGAAGMKAGLAAAGMTLLAAMALATLHLGRPLRAWRAFLGWRTSWFSREILAFGGYAAGLGALQFVHVGDGWRGLAMATAVAGVAGVGCSVLIYAATRRIYWATRSTGIRFGAATMAMGAVGAAVLGIPAPGGPASHAILGLVAIACMLGAGRRPLEAAAVVEEGELYRTTVLLSGPLAVPSRTRHMLAWFAIALLATTLLRNVPGLFVAAMGCLLLSTCIERRLFFTAVAPDRMPGGVAR